MRQNFLFLITAMEKSKILSSLTLRSLLITSLVVALALSLGLSAYAETSSNTIEIDGVLYDEIEITGDQIVALVEDGYSQSQWVFTTTRSYRFTFGDLFNMDNQTKGQFGLSSSIPYALDRDKIFALKNGDDVFIGLPYVYQANRIYAEDDITLNFGVTLPFDAYFYQTPLQISFSSVYTSSQFQFLAVFDGQSTYLDTQNLSTVSPTPYWNTIPLFVDFYNKFNWSPNGYNLSNLRTAFFNYNSTTPQRLIRFSSFTFSNTVTVPKTSGSYSPVGFCIHTPLRVYVEHDISSAVEQYLGLITGRPSASQRQRIQDLENQFQADRENMQDIVDELHVDMPDLEDSDLDIGSMPQEALDGIAEFVPYVSNVFNFNFVVILVTSTLIFTAIKLLLYGSGPS